MEYARSLFLYVTEYKLRHCKGIEFPVSKTFYSKIEQKNISCINVFCYDNDMVYPVYVSNEKCENCMDLLMITDENKSILKIMPILQLLTDLCAIRQKAEIKNTFASIAYNVLVVKEF